MILQIFAMSAAVLTGNKLRLSTNLLYFYRHYSCRISRCRRRWLISNSEHSFGIAHFGFLLRSYCCLQLRSRLIDLSNLA